jgi:hypothetical protein
MENPPKFIEFEGRKYCLSLGGKYYARYPWAGPGPTSLHRAIWEHHFGPIPDYHDIHHKDGDRFNNDIANLECVHRGQHHSDHIKERIASGNPPVLSDAARAANHAYWQQHRTASIAALPRHEATCAECGRTFLTLQPKRAKFCHPNCQQTDLRRRRGMTVGTRPHLKKLRPARGTTTAAPQLYLTPNT